MKHGDKAKAKSAKAKASGKEARSKKGGAKSSKGAEKSSSKAVKAAGPKESSRKAGEKSSPQQLHIVRIVEHNWKDIGAPNADSRQSIIGVPSGTSLPIYSTNF